MQNLNKNTLLFPNKAFIDGQNLETGLSNFDLEIDPDLFFNYLIVTYKAVEVYYFIKFSKYFLLVHSQGITADINIFPAC